MAVITLTTDFGSKDGFIGTLKGVIWGICPGAQIADISHEITPQNVAEGALTLWRAAPYFPPGTVHIAVVDPGVGTDRRALATRIGDHFFVGPDNGIFTPLAQAAQARDEEVSFYQLDQPRYWLPVVSRTFHGRDIFAPAAAHLANGVPLAELGSRIDDPLRLVLPEPAATPQGYDAQIIAVDVFGNLATNLPMVLVAGRGLRVHIKGRVIDGLSPSYGHHQPGDLIALADSENFLEIALVNGSAARELDARTGEPLRVIFSPAD